MFVNSPPQAQHLSAQYLGPERCSQPEHQPQSDLTPSSFHHKVHTGGQKSSTKPDSVHPERPTVSDRPKRETRKSYRCYYEWCDRKFLSDNGRRFHERSVHLLEKPFQCQICLKKFAQKSDARKHLYVHSGAKPYICLTCKRSFSQSSNLFTHIKKQHKIVPKAQDNWIKSWLA